MDIDFSENYDLDKFSLIQVPQDIVDSISNGEELIIKGSENSILCTKNKSYELKFLETSNTIFLLKVLNKEGDEIKNAEILSMENHIIECNDVIPKKYQPVLRVKENCAIYYELKTGQSNIERIQKLTFDDLFFESQLSIDEFKKQFELFNFFEINNGFYTFEENFIFKVIENIFTLFSKLGINHHKFSSEEVFTEDLTAVDPKYKAIIDNFSAIEKTNTLLYIADLISEADENKMEIEGEKASKSFKLNLDKIKNFCVKNIFLDRHRSIKLSEFLSLFRHSLRLILPNELLEIENQNNYKYLEEESCEDNLFEFYKEYDFRFLKNQAYVYFLKTQREPLIHFQAIEELPEKFESRLKELYEKKEKWTVNELRPFLAEFQFSNLEEKLMKFCKIIPEPNPLSAQKSCYFYYLKMPIKI